MMDGTERDRLITLYRAGADAVRAALAGATDEELDARPAPGEWSARQIVHHLADSEMTSAIRLRLLLAADAPTIQAYDEERFAAMLHYDRPIEASLDAMDASRRTSAELLDRLSEADWARRGTHTEDGPYGVERWLEIYARHPYDHAEQIERARPRR